MRKSWLVLVSPFALVVTVTALGCSGAGVGTGSSDAGDGDGSLGDGSLGDGSQETGDPMLPSASDAGAKKKPPSTSCQGNQQFEGSSGSCTLSSTYQCETPSGFDAFRVDCSCPSASCGCYLNGTLTKTVAFNGCPDCTSPVELAKLCGVAGY
jgi:hypothetical protein